MENNRRSLAEQFKLLPLRDVFKRKCAAIHHGPSLIIEIRAWQNSMNKTQFVQNRYNVLRKWPVITDLMATSLSYSIYNVIVLSLNKRGRSNRDRSTIDAFINFLGHIENPFNPSWSFRKHRWSFRKRRWSWHGRIFLFPLEYS